MFRRKGFTLLELIIVIIVIGILSSVALPKYLRITEKARLAEAKSMLGSIRNAQYRYYAQYNTYTDIIANLDLEGYNTSVFFSYSSGLGTTTDLGKAIRNSSLLPSGINSYTLSINEGGAINITPDTYSYLL